MRIDLDYIKALKREFAALAPGTASSHLTEGIAAGFGFKTNAALRATLKQGPVEAAPDEDACQRRLTAMGAEPRPPRGAFSTAIQRLAEKGEGGADR